MSKRDFNNAMRLAASSSGYVKRFGRHCPEWIHVLDRGEASLLLDLACALGTHLRPGHLTWWLSRRSASGESQRRIVTTPKPVVPPQGNARKVISISTAPKAPHKQ